MLARHWASSGGRLAVPDAALPAALATGSCCWLLAPASASDAQAGGATSDPPAAGLLADFAALAASRSCATSGCTAGWHTSVCSAPMLTSKAAESGAWPWLLPSLLLAVGTGAPSARARDHSAVPLLMTSAAGSCCPGASTASAAAPRLMLSRCQPAVTLARGVPSAALLPLLSPAGAALARRQQMPCRPKAACRGRLSLLLALLPGASVPTLQL